jgi:hypothetical protein
VYKGSASTAIVPNIITSLGQTWHIKAFDTRNNYSLLSRSILLDDLVPPEAVTNFNSNILGGALRLSWTESTSLDIIAYEVRTDNSGWGINDANRVYYGLNTSVDLMFNTVGTYNYYIKVRDATNRWSTVQTTQFIYTPITAIDINTIGINFFDDQATSAQVRLSWPDATPQFGVKHYRIVYSGLDFVQTATNFIAPANWIDSRDFNIYVVDNNNISSISTTKAVIRYLPAQVGIPTTTVSGSTINVTWPSATISPNSGYLPISGYEIRYLDENWGLSGYVYKGNSNSASLTPDSSGNGTWSIKAIDTDNEYSSIARTFTFSSDAVPNVSSIDYSYFDSSSTSATITLNWTNGTNPQFGLKHYKVVYDTVEYFTNSNTITLPADWVGDRIFTIYVVDNLNRVSSGYSRTITKLKPNPPSNFYPQVVDNTVMLTWTAPIPTSLPISHYIIKTGNSWETAFDLGRKDGAFTTITELKKGTFTYWIATVDTDNVESDPISKIAEVAEPPDFVFHGNLFTNYQVIDSPTNGRTLNVEYSNSVYDQYVDGSIVLPINISEQYQEHFTSLRVYSMAVVSGGTGYSIDDIVELNTGTQTLKARAKVTAISGSTVTAVQVVSPGNYTVAPSSSGSTTAIVGTGTGLTITASTHSWGSPNDQVVDGYTKFISPTVLSGYYSETWDIETVLGSSKIVVSITRLDNSTLTVTPKIEISSWTNESERWTASDTSYKSYPGSWDVFGVNFRYVRVTLTVNSSDANDIVQFSNLNVLLSAKAITDSNTEVITAQGQVVNFTKDFTDVTSLIVTPSTTTSLTSVYDYKDTILNGTYSLVSNTCTVTCVSHGLISGQNVKVYFASGTAVAGIYTITSYTTDTFSFNLVGSDTSGTIIGYPQGFRIYLFNSSTGSAPTFGSYNVSWFVKGY